MRLFKDSRYIIDTVIIDADLPFFFVGAAGSPPADPPPEKYLLN
jgi:hypothetical protein